MFTVVLLIGMVAIFYGMYSIAVLHTDARNNNCDDLYIKTPKRGGYTLNLKSSVVRERIAKASAHLEWIAAQSVDDQPAGLNKATGESFTFSKPMVERARAFVADQEKNNPNWDEWVAEWSSRD